MKRLAILLSLLLVLQPLASANSAHVSAFQWQGGITNTTFHLNTLPYIDVVQLNPGWVTLDTGTTAPSFSYSTWEALSVANSGGVQELIGYPLVGCTNPGGTVTCTDTGATWPFTLNQHIYIQGATGGTPTCSGDYVVTNVSATQIQFASANCTGTGGVLMDSCGSAITGTAKGVPCLIGMAVGTNINDGNQRMPQYPGTQAYANSIVPAWSANTQYPFHAIVTHGGHYYHSTTLCTGGACSEATFGATITWADDGTSNAFVQEFSVGTGYPTGGPVGNQPPISIWANGGATYSVNTMNCGTGTQQCQIGDTVTGYPWPWETPYLTAITNFCVGTDGTNPGFLPHYHALLGSQLLYAMCGGPHGVEWFGDLEPYYTGAAYNLSFNQYEGLFLTYAGNYEWQAIHNEWVTLGSPAWGMIVADGIYQGCSSDANCSIHSDLIAKTSITAGYPENSPAYFGLRAADLTNYATGAQIRGDWINIANGVLGNLGGTIPSKTAKFYMLEPLGLSCPPSFGGWNNVNCNTTQSTTGSLTQIFPFATQRIPVPAGSATLVVAAFGDDLTCAYAASCGVGTNYPAATNTQYQSTFTNLAAGVPNTTSGSIGKSGTLGTAGNQ